MHPLQALFVALLLASVVHRPAAAHGSVTPEDDVCIIRVGYYKAHFKIYLPRSNGHRDYCEDVPGSGETIFVMEYEHSGLGDVPIDFRIVRNITGQGVFTNLEDVQAIDNLDAVTVVHHAAAVQPDVFTLMYNFEEDGEFVGIVTVHQPGTDTPYTAVFPFEVGFAGFGWWPWFALAAVLLQVNYFLMNGGLARWRKRQRRRKLTVVAGTDNA